MEDGLFFKIGVNAPKPVGEENNIYKECAFLHKMVARLAMDQPYLQENVIPKLVPTLLPKKSRALNYQQLWNFTEFLTDPKDTKYVLSKKEILIYYWKCQVMIDPLDSRLELFLTTKLLQFLQHRLMILFINHLIYNTLIFNSPLKIPNHVLWFLIKEILLIKE